jgi:hypothetical protein
MIGHTTIAAIFSAGATVTPKILKGRTSLNPSVQWAIVSSAATPREKLHYLFFSIRHAISLR